MSRGNASDVELARAFLLLHAEVSPTNVVFLKKMDTNLPSILHRLNPDTVVVAPNSVVAVWDTHPISFDYTLVRSETETNVWTLFRWYFLANRSLATITNRSVRRGELISR